MPRARRTPRYLLPALAALVAAPAAAVGELSQVVPGVTYERLDVGGQVHHVARVTQGPLVSVRPVLTAGVPTRRAPLTDAMRVRLGEGAVVGVNGDYFNLENAYPSGLLISGGEVVSEPEPTRSALVFGPGGVLAALKTELVGTWQASDPTVTAPFLQRGFVGVNRPSERTNETLVYTSKYGDVTPVGDRVDALVTMDPPGVMVPNTPLTGTVQAIQSGGGVGVAPGKLVISGVGTAGNGVTTDLVPGRRVTINFGLAGLLPGTEAAIGGGPALVQNGVPVAGVTEGFTSGQIGTRTSRTALGQTADGTVLLVTSEGPFQGSPGITMVEQAQLLATLGAQTAVGMDGGGSAMMSLRDRLVTNWASERAITNAVVVTYAGVQLTQPAPLVSPNGDGVDDATAITARAPKDGTGRISLVRPNGGVVKDLYAGPLGPSGQAVSLTKGTLKVKDGRYRVVAQHAPADGSAPTTHSHDVIVDRSIGFLRLKKFGKPPQARVQIGFRVGRGTRATVVVEDPTGKAIKVIFRNRRLKPGTYGFVWDMKRRGKRVAPGTYTISLRSQRPYGQPTLDAPVRVAPLKG